MARTHAHGHGEESGGRSLLIALALNVGIVAAQVIGGLLSGSLALLADAVHNLSDAAALGISYGARRIARRDPDQRRTFGYARVETVAALINLTALIIVAFYLLVQAVTRLFNPQEVHGTTMLVVGGIAFAEDLLSVIVLSRGAKQSMNIRSSMLHLAADTLSTIAVIAGAAAVMIWNLTWIDPVLTMLISVFILFHAVRALRSAASVLIESAPKGFDLDGAVRVVEEVPGVLDIHHIHVWRLDEQRVAVEAHLVMDRADLGEIEQVKREVKAVLHDRFGVEHTTLEVEIDACVKHERAVIARHEAGSSRHQHLDGNHNH